MRTVMKTNAEQIFDLMNLYAVRGLIKTISLRQVSDRLAAAVRTEDTVARLGGDEFAVLSPNLSDALGIERLATRMVEEMVRPFTILGSPVNISGSVGVAIAPRDGSTVEELMVNADAAMYESKKAGRNTFSLYAGGAQPNQMV